MNDGISASCKNASPATLKVAAEITSLMKRFYILKRRNIFMMKQLGDAIATLCEIVVACHWV
jgi:hypothetical protein